MEDETPLVYGGQEVRRTKHTISTAARWHLALPDDDMYYPVTVQAQPRTEACFAAVEAIAYDVMDSFHPRAMLVGG